MKETTCALCGRKIRIDDGTAYLQHVLCPYCGGKFSYLENAAEFSEERISYAIAECRKNESNDRYYSAAPAGARLFIGLQFYSQVFKSDLNLGHYLSVVAAIEPRLKPIDWDYLLRNEKDPELVGYFRKQQTRCAEDARRLGQDGARIKTYKWWRRFLGWKGAVTGLIALILVGCVVMCLTWLHLECECCVKCVPVGPSSHTAVPALPTAADLPAPSVKKPVELPPCSSVETPVRQTVIANNAMGDDASRDSKSASEVLSGYKTITTIGGNAMTQALTPTYTTTYTEKSTKGAKWVKVVSKTAQMGVNAFGGTADDGLPLIRCGNENRHLSARGIRGNRYFSTIGNHIESEARRSRSPEQPKPTNRSVGTERYAEYIENEFVSVASEPLSTFGLDVDTASYTTMRRYFEIARESSFVLSRRAFFTCLSWLSRVRQRIPALEPIR